MLPLIIGAGATIGSSLLNNAANSKVNKARNNVLGAERARQAELDAEAAGVNKGARERYVDFSGQQDARAQTLGDMFRPAASPAAPGVMPETTSKLIGDAVTARMGEAKAFGDQQGQALGNLRAFGDVMGTINRAQGRDAGTIGQIGNFKRGSADVSTLELEDAGHAGDKLKFFGDILAGVGKIGLMAGLGGLAPAAAAGGAAATGAGAVANGASSVASAFGSAAPFSTSTLFANPWTTTALTGASLADMFAPRRA